MIIINDQAKRLREIMNNVNFEKVSNVKEVSKKNARVITITSGKGGVGKSNSTINLGLALRKLGYSVTILDADLGLANIDIIIGVLPKYTLAHVMSREKTLKEVVTEGPNGIKLISGGSGLKNLANLTEEDVGFLIENLSTLGESTDFMLIDTGAGINNTVLSFIEAAGEIILVTTPEPTSITDAYAVLKNIISKDKEKIIRVLINRVEDHKEGEDVFNKLNTASQRFLKLPLKCLGYLYDDKVVTKSVKLQIPFLISHPKSLVSQGIETIAYRLTNESSNEVSEISGFKKFINKFMVAYKKSF